MYILAMTATVLLSILTAPENFSADFESVPFQFSRTISVVYLASSVVAITSSIIIHTT